MIKYFQNNKQTYTSIIVMAFPIIVQGLVFELQSLTDKAFLGNIDSLYISVMGACQIPFNTTLDCLAALSIGITIIVSQMHGVSKKKEILDTVKSSIFYSSIISFCIFVLWFAFSAYIFKLLSVDKNIVGYCISYVRICSIYFLFLGIDLSLQAMLQGIGDTKPIMYSGLTKVFLNVFLAWVLILGNMGFPSLGVKGAAIAAATANVLSSLMLVTYCFIIKRKTFGFRNGKIISFKFSPYKATIRLGLPTGLEFLLWDISNLIMVKFLNKTGYMATTIYTLTFLCIEGFVYTIFFGISKAALTLQGNRIGQDDAKGAKKILNASIVMGAILVIFSLIVFILFSRQILGVFTNDEKIIDESIPYLIFAGVILLPKSINVIVGSGIRAYGDTKWMLYTQIIGSVIVASGSYVLINVVGLNLAAVYITCLADETIRASINCFHYYKGKVNRFDVSRLKEEVSV